MTQPIRSMPDDARECAYVRLKGASERLLMILEHRSERNYELAMQAVERCMAEYRAFGDKSE